MRLAAILASLMLFISAAAAEEVELTLTPDDSESTTYAVLNDSVNYKMLQEAPEGVTAPEGSLQWGALSIGEYGYIACVVMENNAPKKLYLDRDGDKNLAEETPVEVLLFMNRFPVFRLNDVAFKFKLGESALDGKVPLWVTHSATSAVIFKAAYVGKVKTECGDVTIAWAPGSDGVLALPPSLASLYNVIYITDKKFEIIKNSLTVRNGKLFAKYELKTVEGIASLKAPAGLTALVAYNEDGTQVPALPSGDKVCLPKKTYNFITIVIKKELENIRWELTSYISNFEAKNGAEIGAVLPLSCDLKITQNGGQIIFQPSIADASGRAARIVNNKDVVLFAPTLIIKDGDGKEIAKHAFQPG